MMYAAFAYLYLHLSMNLIVFDIYSLILFICLFIHAVPDAFL